MLIDYNVINLLIIGYVLIGFVVGSFLGLIMTGIKKYLALQDKGNAAYSEKRKAVTGISPKTTALQV